ncbi:MAG TPA: TetR/AcrR family transcriptional regulator [Micromonosporaceae bacterium]|nr:TetR/AcrR family transcriptional regulator [Micromonosporaceae bacterium]
MTTDVKRTPAGAAVLRGDITEAIERALVQELAAVGYGRLSIEAVARRAGVAKTAVYRRWNSKLDLVLDVVNSVADSKLPIVDTGSLRGDLEVFLQVVARLLRHPLASQIIPDLLAEAARTPEIGETLEKVLRAHQRHIGEQLLGAARDRGELAGTADPDLVVDLIVGPLYWRLAIARTPVSGTDLRRMAAASAAALEALCPKPPTAEGAPSAPAQGELAADALATSAMPAAR